MRILFIIPHYEPAWHLGGIVSSISQLCRGLAHLGHEVTVFATDSARNCRMPVPVNQEQDIEGVKIYYFKTQISLKFAYSPALAQACRQNLKNFDIVHIASIWCYPEIPAAAAARRCKVPYLVSLHGTLRKAALQNKRWKKWLYFHALEKRIIAEASAIHYTTTMERELNSHLKLHTPSFIVPNGIDPVSFRNFSNAEREQAKLQLGLRSHSKVISFLGRINSGKGLDLLIRAIANDSLRKMDLHLILAGPDDGAEKTLRLLVSRLNLDGRVIFLGTIGPERKNQLLASSDILALVSKNENFGMAAAEGMMSGVPVLVSEHVGICREVAADGAGLVVPLQVGAVEDALCQLISNPEALKSMGQSAAVSARRRYDIKIVAQQMERAYEDILTMTKTSNLNWES